MPTYRWVGAYPREDVTAAQAPGGYPWVELDADGNPVGHTEIAAPTSDAVLADVGTDKAKATAASKAEDKKERKGRRPALKRKLDKVAE